MAKRFSIKASLSSFGPAYGIDAADWRAVGHRRAHRNHHCRRFSTRGHRPSAARARRLCLMRDYLLYRHAKLGRVSLNLGGIANITVLPRAAKPERVFAFDTGPANMLIDALVSHFTRGRLRFDKNAQLARKAAAIPRFSMKCCAILLKSRAAKSTGREILRPCLCEEIPRAWPPSSCQAKRSHPCRRQIFHRTLVVDALNRFVLSKSKIDQLIVSRGGARIR